jgi:GT2 family glycosyltransferase
MTPDISLVTVTFGDAMSATRVGTGLEAAQRTAGEPPAEVIVVAVGPDGRAAADALVGFTVGTSLKPEIIEVDAGTGYASAANVGAAKATGEIIVVAKPEVTFHQRFLKRLRIEAAESWDFLAPMVREGEDGKVPGGVTKRTKAHRLVPVENPPTASQPVTSGSGACVIVRRAILERRTAEAGGLFEEAFDTAGELDLFWWAERNGLLVRYVPTLIVGNAVGQDVIETADERRQAMANYRLTVWKHGSRNDASGWLLGEAAFISEEVGAGGLSGLVRYVTSWRDTVKSAQAIKKKRGGLRR